MALARHPRRARTEALSTAGAFVGLSVAFTLLMEVRFPHWTDREYAARRERILARVAESPDRPVLAVLGSSRVGTGFAPEVLGDLRAADGRPVCAFNYSHMGAGPRLNLLTLRRLQRDGVRPPWVLLELLPGHLHREETFFTDLSLADVAALRPLWADGRLPLRLFKYRLDAPARYRRVAVESVCPAFTSGKPTALGEFGGDEGFERPAAMSDRERAALGETIREQYRDRLGDFRLDPAQDRILRATIGECRAQGTQVALVIFPESRTYRDWYGPGVALRIDQYVRQLRDECGVPVYDTRDWMADEAFNDPHHLSADGARAYTLRLGNEVLRPFLAGSPP